MCGEFHGVVYVLVGFVVDVFNRGVYTVKEVTEHSVPGVTVMCS